MKKNLLFAAFAAVAMTASAEATVIFDGNETAGWSFVSGSEVSYENGNAVVKMAEQSNGKYRADIQYRGDGIAFDPATDKVVAIQFVGDKPACNISFEVQDPDLGGYFGKNNFQNSVVSDDNGNQIVYLDLSGLTIKKDDVTYTYSESAAFTTKSLTIKIADATAPTTYTIGSIKLGKDLNEILGIKPAITNITSGDEFADLASAFSKASEGDEIMINRNIDLSGRLTIPCKLTISGASKDVTINRNFNGIMMLVNAETTFSNITLSSKEGTQSNVLLEVNKVLATFNDVEFLNVSSSKNQGIVAMKQGGKFDGNNVTFTNCEAVNTECPAVLFMGTNGRVSLDGKMENVSVLIEKTGASINAGENLSAVTPIAIALKNAAGWTSGTVVVNGSTDTEMFTLADTDLFNLSAVEGGIAIVDKNTSGIDDITAGEETKEYFDLMGRKVANPSNGVFVVREGNKVYKVAL